MNISQLDLNLSPKNIIRTQFHKELISLINENLKSDLREKLLNVVNQKVY
jgi:hypothetical protein